MNLCRMYQVIFFQYLLWQFYSCLLIVKKTQNKTVFRFHFKETSLRKKYFLRDSLEFRKYQNVFLNLFFMQVYQTSLCRAQMQLNSNRDGGCCTTFNGFGFLFLRKGTLFLNSNYIRCLWFCVAFYMQQKALLKTEKSWVLILAPLLASIDPIKSQSILVWKRSNHIHPIHSITQLINLNNDHDSSKCITCNSNLNNLFGQWVEKHWWTWANR